MCSGIDIDEREARSPRVLRCELIDPFGRSHTCLMRNISKRGVGGSGCEALAVGERITVVLPVVGPIPGTVRWVARDKFGINLDWEINPEAIRFTGTSANAPAPHFRVMDIHQVSNDCRRPPLRAA